MKILISSAICFATVAISSCIDPNYYPPPSRDFRPYGSEAERLRQQGRLPQQDTRDSANDRGYLAPQQQAPVERVPRRDEYPTATKTANPNQVLSPYKPFNVIDIEGFRSGQLAKDPSNQQIFRIP